MSGNVGKYGETQAQICPYSQQTLKVWLRARANLQLVNHTLIGQIEAPKQLLARLARICPILVWGRADRPCQVELNALEKEGGEPPSVSSQKNWSLRIIYQLDNILEYQNEILLQTTQNLHIDLCLQFKFWEWKSIREWKKGIGKCKLILVLLPSHWPYWLPG